MFINKQLDDDLKKYIDGIDWTDTVPDTDKNNTRLIQNLSLIIRQIYIISIL